MIGLSLILAILLPKSPIVNYPRVAMYAHFRPLAPDSSIDTSAVRLMAKWDVVILDPPRGWRSGAITLLRRYNRNITLLPYFMGGRNFICGWGWQGQSPPDPGCDTTGASLAWSRHVAIREHDGYLWNTQGKPFSLYGAMGWIDFAKPELATALADTALAWASGWTGIFSDEMIDLLRDAPGETLDFERAGFVTREAWEAAYAEGRRAYFTRLRKRMSSAILVANGGQRGPKDIINGWMRENFPHQNGNPATWESNMLGWIPGDTGYLGDDTSYVQPSLCWLTTMRAGRADGDPSFQRDCRFGLASATLANGVWAPVGTDFDPLRGYQPLWLDEYAVDSLGHATSSKKHKGWLGIPYSRAYKQGVCWRRDFSRGIVLVNPSFRPAQIVLSCGFYRINGTTSVNTGALADTVSVPAQDGIFLQRR